MYNHMGIDKHTLQTIKDNYHKFSQKLQDSINIVLQLSSEFSPLSDLFFLLSKTKKTLPAIEIPKTDIHWMPIRNVIRIIANVSNIATNQIESIKLGSMICGCDYFEGTIEITQAENEVISGNYKWQWTQYSGRDLSFDKFIIFPNLKNVTDESIKSEKLIVSK